MNKSEVNNQFLRNPSTSQVSGWTAHEVSQPDVFCCLLLVDSLTVSILFSREERTIDGVPCRCVVAYDKDVALCLLDARRVIISLEN